MTNSGTMFCPGSSSKRKRRIINANIIFASNIAKFCPIHEREPAENGKYRLSDRKLSNLDGSNLDGSCQYFSELFWIDKMRLVEIIVIILLMKHEKINSNFCSFLNMNFFSITGSQCIVLHCSASYHRYW